MRLPSDRQDGFSLVELLIVVGILAVVGAASSTFLMRAAKNAVSSEAAKKSAIMVHEVSQLIARDILYMDKASPTSIGAAGNSLSFKRKGFADGAFNAQDYTVLFENKCRSASSLANSYGSGSLQSLYSAANLTKISACLKLINCPSHTVPYMRISVIAAPTVQVPNYPITRFPSVSTDKANDVLGSAACYFRIGNQLKVMVQAVYGKGGGQIGVVGEEMIHNIGPTGFQVIPQVGP